MKYGYPALSGVITDPVKALDKIIKAYFKSDSQKHGIDVSTYSLRWDVHDGDDVAGNIKNSLDDILSSYFEVSSVECSETEVSGNIRTLELTIYVSDGGEEITFDKVVNLEDGDVSSIVDAGQL